MNLELDDQQAAALVLGGRRDAGIAVNDARIVHQKCASEMCNFDQCLGFELLPNAPSQVPGPKDFRFRVRAENDLDVFTRGHLRLPWRAASRSGSPQCNGDPRPLLAVIAASQVFSH
jgi:hypothetical protein